MTCRKHRLISKTHWSPQSTKLSSHPQPAQDQRLFFLVVHGFSWDKQKGSCSNQGHQADRKQPSLHRNTYAQNGTGGLEISLPSMPSARLCNSAFCEHCSGVGMYTLESFRHARFLKVSSFLEHHPPPSLRKKSRTTTVHVHQEGESRLKVLNSH